MRQELTQTVRDAIRRAEVEARALNQEFVGTDHLVLGLLDRTESEAAQAIHSVTDRQGLHSAMLALLPRGEQEPLVTGHLPFSPKAQRAVNDAAARAQSAGAERSSSRFLFQTLLDEPQSALRQAIERVGAQLDDVRRALDRPAESIES